jgi:predicted nucleotidyltransferase
MQGMCAADWLSPLRERELLPVDGVAAFVVGSVARGWDNERSDFDIYVVADSEWESDSSDTAPLPLDPPRNHSEIFYHMDRRWEVTYWLANQFEQMFSKVSWDEYERGIFANEVLTHREELALGRLGTCLPLRGDEWIVKNQERLATTAFRSFLVIRSLNSADDAAEDALGQMNSGHMESATISARRALGHAIDALLEAHGEYGSQTPKWRPNRFRAASPAMLSFDKYWALETMRDYDPGDPRPWIKEVLTLCHDISIRVETR